MLLVFFCRVLGWRGRLVRVFGFVFFRNKFVFFENKINLRGASLGVGIRVGVRSRGGLLVCLGVVVEGFGRG